MKHASQVFFPLLFFLAIVYKEILSLQLCTQLCMSQSLSRKKKIKNRDCKYFPQFTVHSSFFFLRYQCRVIFFYSIFFYVQNSVIKARNRMKFFFLGERKNFFLMRKKKHKYLNWIIGLNEGLQVRLTCTYPELMQVKMTNKSRQPLSHFASS